MHLYVSSAKYQTYGSGCNVLKPFFLYIDGLMQKRRNSIANAI